MSMRRKQTLVILAGTAILVAGALTVAVAGKERPEQESRVIVFGGHARLGVQVGDVTAEKARELNLPGEYGAVIEEVEEESPAARAGLQEKDVILSFDGERVRSVAHLARLVRETPADRQVTLEVSRGGQRRTVQATLEPGSARMRLPEVHVGRIEIPPIPPIRIPEIDIGRIWGGPRLGISGDELTPQLAEYFGVKQGKGVLVREVLAGSAAAKAELKAGDVIVRVNDEDVSDVNDLRRALRRQREEKEITVTIVRDRREQAVKVELEEQPRYSRRRIARGQTYWDSQAWERYAEDGEAAARAVGEYLESKAFREQMHRIENQIREAEKKQRKLQEYRESPEFQRQMRELERQMKKLERTRGQTQVI